MSKFVIWSILFLLGNSLDLLTTYQAMKGIPKEEMKERELNVFLDSRIHDRKFVLILKFGVALLLIGVLVYWYFRGDSVSPYYSLKILVVLIFLVVLNNLYANWARGHGRLTSGRLLVEKLKFPKGLAYFTVVFILFFISVMVAQRIPW